MPEVGTELTPVVIAVSRADARAYADASGDHNPIHTDDAAAQAIGQPGVISHGMWTMGAALRAVTENLPGARIRELACAFTAPVPLPPDGVARLVVSGTVAAPDRLKLEVRRESDGERVARLGVRLG